MPTKRKTFCVSLSNSFETGGPSTPGMDFKDIKSSENTETHNPKSLNNPSYREVI
jgi:hypothetical protein